MAFVKVKIPRTSQPQDACGLDASYGVSTAWSATNAKFELATSAPALLYEHEIVPTQHGLGYKSNGQFVHVSVPATRPTGRFLLVTAFTNASSIASEIIASTKDYWNQPDGFFVGSKNDENTLEISGGGGGFPQIPMPGLGAAGAYHRLVVDFDGATATGYLDGVRMGAVAITPVNPFKDNRMGIGTYSNNANADSRRLYHLSALVTQGDPISLSANPWQIFEPEELTIWIPDIASSPADNLTPKNITLAAATISTPIVGQVHVLSGNSTNLSSVTVTSPTIYQVHQLTSKSISADAVTVTKPVLSYVPAVVDLTGSSISLSAVAITNPLIDQVHALISKSVNTGSATIGTPILNQVHAIVGKGVTLSNVTVVSPVISQVQILSGQGIHIGAVTVTKPTLTSASNIDNLIAKSIAIEALQLSKPSIEQIHVLTSLDVSLDNFTVTESVIGQVHVLIPQPITLSATVASKPDLTSLANTDNLSPKDITLGALTVSNPVITQVHTLVGKSLVTGSISIVKPVLRQVHGLTPKDINLGSWKTTKPILIIGGITEVYVDEILSDVVDDKVIVLLQDEVIQVNILSETI